jgi:hypothetical protein
MPCDLKTFPHNFNVRTQLHPAPSNLSHHPDKILLNRSFPVIPISSKSVQWKLRYECWGQGGHMRCGDVRRFWASNSLRAFPWHLSARASTTSPSFGTDSTLKHSTFNPHHALASPYHSHHHQPAPAPNYPELGIALLCAQLRIALPPTGEP